MRARLRELGSVLVCYSGGVDSAFVLAVAHAELGPRAVGMTAVSPSLAPAEKEDAAVVAQQIGADHQNAIVDSAGDKRVGRRKRVDPPGTAGPHQPLTWRTQDSGGI